jgi:hypothetical protein
MYEKESEFFIVQVYGFGHEGCTTHIRALYMMGEVGILYAKRALGT